MRAGADENVTITMPSAQTIPSLSGGSAAEAGKYVSGVTVSGHAVTVTKESLPTTLKNPTALTFGSKTYDGSEAKTITAADLGLGQAMRYIGKTSTDLSESTTSNTITIDSKSVTAQQGDVVIDKNNKKEYIWNGSGWEELGNEGNYKTKQTAKASPDSSGSAASFIDTISQDENGVITATKKSITNNVTYTGTLVDEQVAVFEGTSGQIKASGYTIAKSVPSDAKFTDTNTHYTTGLYIGASGAKSNAATTNGNTYLKLYDDSTSRASFKISGSGTVSVDSDPSGNITITGANTNTDYQCTNAGHYTPTGSDKTGTASGSTLSFGGAVVTGLTYDDKGHVTGFATSKLPANPNTDTNTWRGITDSVSTTDSTISGSATAVKTAYDKAVSAYNLANGKTSNTGTVTSVATGAGLVGGTITATGTIKCNLNSETSLGTIGSTSKLYAVGVDANGKLCVSVPWTDADTNTNYYHTRVYSSGLKISTGTGVSDMYVPTASTTQDGAMTSAMVTKLNGIATGATANTGTVTGVKINGVTMTPTNGVVDIGTVIQTLSGYLPLSGGTMTGCITTPGNDSVVIKPASNNYDQIGGADCKFWKIHATQFCGNATGLHDQYSDGTNISASYCNGELTAPAYLACWNYNESNGTYEITKTLASNFSGGGSSTDENVKCSPSSTSSNYPLLFKYNSASTEYTGNVKFNYYVTLNPGTRTLNVGSASGTSYLGSVNAGNGFFQQSDERLKDFHGNIPVDFEALKSIPKQYFTWKEVGDDVDNKLRIGTGAQSLQKIYPELVTENDGILTVAYDKLSIVALAAIDKLHEENQELKARIEKLEQLISKLV